MTGRGLRTAGGREPPRWLDPRGRHLGTWAFVLNRLTGLGLVVYLYLHLIVLSTLLRGPQAWDGLVAWIRNPAVFAIEALLLLTVTVHGIAGVHAVLLDLGLRGRSERIVERVLRGLAAVTVVYGLWLLAAIASRG